MDMYRHFEIQRTKLEQIQENSARLAKASGTFTTTGPGQFVAGTPFMFGLSFLEQPSFTSRSAVDPSTDLVAGDYPVANAMAYDWILTPKGYYIGAHIFFVVTSTSSYIVNHNFSFEGNAIKDFLASASDLDF